MCVCVCGEQFLISIKLITYQKKKKKNNLVNMNNEAIRPPIQAMSRKGKKLSLY